MECQIVRPWQLWKPGRVHLRLRVTLKRHANEGTVESPSEQIPARVPVRELLTNFDRE